MKIDRYKYVAILFFGLVGFAACTDINEMEVPDNSNKEAVTTFLSLEKNNWINISYDEEPGTRAPLDVDETTINNVWVFQFGATAGNDDERKLVCPPYYIDETAIANAASNNDLIPVPLIESGTEVHLIAFVANTNNKDYSWGLRTTAGQESTYSELKSRTILMNNTQEAYTYGTDKKNILMSGKVYSVVKPEIVLDSNPNANDHEAGVPLNHSLARVEMNLSIDAAAADYKVISVQLRNVVSSIEVADFLKVGNEHPVYTPEMDYVDTYPVHPTLIDFPKEENTTAGLVTLTDNNKKYIWYIPRNMRGKSSSSVPRTKNLYAPQGATFIEIVALRTTDNTAFRYRIYPGANNCDDYTIVPNHNYIINLNITGGGGEVLNDFRVEQLNRVRFDGANNSFILNPPEIEGMGDRTFEIPITRVNEYWRPTWIAYGGNQENVLLSTDEWEAELLWQDDKDMVRATQENPDKIYFSKKTGKGGDDYFSITVPHNARIGNFVVVLRKGNPGAGDVLWSWHFWVTDYNPDEQKLFVPQGRQFVYPVAGGHVERYGGKIWGYDATVNGEESKKENFWNNYTYNPNSTQPYARKFMMDRPLGALNNNTNPLSTRGNYLYQYGRKDVVIGGSTTLYDISGNILPTTPSPDFKAQYKRYGNGKIPDNSFKAEMTDMVRYPMTYYYGGYYLKDLTENVYLWHDSRIDRNDITGKSIYDPCPPGWHVPVINAWEDFRDSYTTNMQTNFRNFLSDTEIKGVLYWPYVEIDGGYPIENKIYYPKMGFKWYGDFSHREVGTQAYYMSVSHSDKSNHLNSHFVLRVWSGSIPNVLLQVDSKNQAGSVRCISQ